MDSNNNPASGEMHPLALTSVASFALWDASALDRQVGKNTALQVRLLEKFLLNGKRQVAELTAAVAARRPELTAEIAHALKANARCVGALQLGESCQRIEQAGFAGNGADCVALAQVVADDFVKVSQVIAESLT